MALSLPLLVWSERYRYAGWGTNIYVVTAAAATLATVYLVYTCRGDGWNMDNVRKPLPLPVILFLVWFCSFSTAFANLWFGTRILNALLDRSVPETRILTVHKKTAPSRKSPGSVYVDLEGNGKPESMPVPSRIHRHTLVGPDALRVTVHKGAFGYPWVSHMEPAR